MTEERNNNNKKKRNIKKQLRDADVIKEITPFFRKFSFHRYVYVFIFKFPNIANKSIVTEQQLKENYFFVQFIFDIRKGKISNKFCLQFLTSRYA